MKHLNFLTTFDFVTAIGDHVSEVQPIFAPWSQRLSLTLLTLRITILLRETSL